MWYKNVCTTAQVSFVLSQSRPLTDGQLKVLAIPRVALFVAL